MDRDRAQLIVSLCTQVGMIMEDASLVAGTMPGQAEDRIGEALMHLEAEVTAMATLLAAAQTLHGRG